MTLMACNDIAEMFPVKLFHFVSYMRLIFRGEKYMEYTACNAHVETNLYRRIWDVFIVWVKTTSINVAWK